MEHNLPMKGENFSENERQKEQEFLRLPPGVQIDHKGAIEKQIIDQNDKEVGENVKGFNKNQWRVIH
jgi:hypothetical protein